MHTSLKLRIFYISLMPAPGWQLKILTKYEKTRTLLAPPLAVPSFLFANQFRQAYGRVTIPFRVILLKPVW